MKGVLNKFRKRNIQTNILHFTLVIFVVAVSVCLITGLFINYLTLNRSVNQFYNNSNLPNLWIETNQISTVDDSFYSSRFEYTKRYKFDSDFRVGSGVYQGEFLISSGKVSIPYIIDGEREKGCYVDKRFAEKYHFGLNHSSVYFDYTINGITKTFDFQIVGFITLAEDLINDGDCVIFIDENLFLDELKSRFSDYENSDLSVINYNQILITSEVDEFDVQKIEAYYQNSESKLERIYTKEQTDSFKSLQNEINIAGLMLWLFPMIFMVIAFLTVVSTISQLTTKERYNIGLLKSLGIRNKQILSNYCGYGSFVCFFGAVLGLLIAPLIIPNMTFATFDNLYKLPRDEMVLTYPKELMIFMVIFSIFIGYFSAFLVIIRLIKKTPKECMFKPQKKGLKSRKIMKKMPTWLGCTLRNMKLNLARTIMSIVSVMGCSLLILIGFGVENIMKKYEGNKGFYSLGVYSEIFKSFAIVLMILSIIILLMQIFREREKEMSMLRIHGESYLKIWGSVLLEVVVICLISFTCSAILSFPVLLLNLNIFSINKYFSINFLGYLKTFLLLFFIIAFVSIFVLIKIYKLKLSELIKDSE